VRTRRLLLIAVGWLITATPAQVAFAANSTVSQSAAVRASNVVDVAQSALHALRTKSSSTDTQWYASGRWHFTTGDDTWFTQAGPATLEATLWRVTGGTASARKARAIQTFDLLLARYQNADGSFGTDAVATQFFANELATTYLVLGNALARKTRARWRHAIAGAASFMIKHGDVTWEANGNVNLGETELQWLAWAITGASKFRDAYELEWTYLVAPPQDRWPGYGLHFTRMPRRADGADGAGYLAENGGSGPGYDPEYTMLQLSEAAHAFLLSDDPRFLRLANLMANQLDERTTHPQWILDARGGSRRSHVEPFTSAGITVLATAGGRTDLLRQLNAQSGKMYSTYLANAVDDWGNAGYYRGYGLDLGTALLDLAPARAETSPARPTTPRTSAAGVQRLAKPSRVHLLVSDVSTGLHVKWSLASVASTKQLRLSVDGRLRRIHRHGDLVLHVRPGLHQVAIVVASSDVTEPLATAVVTRPVRP
jgi:hypothetical protein